MLAIDWGLSSFRAWRLGADGTITAHLAAPRGVRDIAPGGFAPILADLLSPWPGAATEPMLFCGMVGSRQGWVEAAYAPCPARPRDIAAALVAVPGMQRAFIVPGLSCRNAGVADVMRGEETQILGLLPDLGPGQHVLCLPGTHSKWATVEDGRITGFRTAMTGEVFALMRNNSTLAPLVPPDAGGAASDEPGAAFDAGVDRAAASGGLLHHLFGIRAATLLGDLAPGDIASLLSGLLIGHEIAALAGEAGDVHLVGAAGLAARYARALARGGRRTTSHGEESAARGLHAIAAARGLA